ncbi:Rieske 2Fe-2S domain-containing protein [Myxococcota bacterium]|nr:Rieske 2Fe-2S domain-containing protein [Myxococcota bacterium]
MGLRDLLKEKAEKHGGLRGLAKEALRRAGGSGAEATSPPTSPSSSPPSPAEPVQAVAPVSPPAPVSAPAPVKPKDDGPFVKVARSEQVPEGKAGTYVIGEDAIAVFRVKGKLFAIDQTCVHEDGPLGEGKLEGHVVSCPYHDWRYDVRDGRCLSATDRAVACFAVKEEGGAILIGRKVSESSGERGGAHDDGLQVIVKDIGKI